MDRVLVFRLGQKVFDFLLDGSPRFTRDGERGATRYRRLGVSRVATVGRRQVDGEATVIAEALEAVAFPFLLSELAVCADAWVGPIDYGGVGQCGWVVALFCWCKGRGRLPVLTRGCGLLALALPITSVASQSVHLELLERLRVIQRQELVLDVLFKSSIELTIKSRIIPPCVGRMFVELNHVLVDMLIVIHLECA